MKTTQLLFTVVAFAFSYNSYSSGIQTKIQSVFGDKPVLINDYDDQLKEVVIDTKIYFATHDGRYLFAGPIFDTERREDIATMKENQLRQIYLSSLPKDIFISYPSAKPKHQITVFTDIDCGYCRKLHNHMARFNELGISVNYLMLPRAGIGSESYKKTVATLCSDNPAASITRAMQNDNPAPLNCENNVMSQHLDIVRDLKINSTPTIVLPGGELKPGLIRPDQLIALLEGDQQ